MKSNIENKFKHTTHNLNSMIKIESNPNINEQNLKLAYDKSCKKYGSDFIQPIILNPVRRIIVLGDIHGDYNLAIELLQIAQVIKLGPNNYIEWTGTDTYVVQVGDQIDSCRPKDDMTCTSPETTLNDIPKDIELLKLFSDLHSKAIVSGGAVISLLGNHELMNVDGELDYVSSANLQASNGYKGRMQMFKPGQGPMAILLGCTRQIAVIIGKHFFVHAGFVDSLVNELQLDKSNAHVNLTLINTAVKLWLLGKINKESINLILKSPDSMFWTRKLGNINPKTPMTHPTCANNISQVLKTFNINGIIVGHTPQNFKFNQGINSTCDNSVWRVDVGSSLAFDRFDDDLTNTNVKSTHRRAQVLEIINDSIYNVLG